MPLPPNCAATSSTSGDLAMRTSLWPLAASSRAHAAPMPWEAAVTIAIDLVGTDALAARFSSTSVNANVLDTEPGGRRGSSGSGQAHDDWSGGGVRQGGVSAPPGREVVDGIGEERSPKIEGPGKHWERPREVDREVSIHAVEDVREIPAGESQVDVLRDECTRVLQRPGHEPVRQQFGSGAA